MVADAVEAGPCRWVLMQHRAFQKDLLADVVCESVVPALKIPEARWGRPAQGGHLKQLHAWERGLAARRT